MLKGTPLLPLTALFSLVAWPLWQTAAVGAERPSQRNSTANHSLAGKKAGKLLAQDGGKTVSNSKDRDGDKDRDKDRGGDKDKSLNENSEGDKSSVLDENEERAIAAAKEFLNAKQYAKAVAVLSQAIDKAPLSAPLHLWRGNAYWAFCNYREAIKEFDSAIKQDDLSADAWAHKAVCFARLGLYDAAADLFKSAAKKKTADATVTMLTSRALFEYKEYKAVLEYLKDFDEKQIPGQAEVLANISLTKAQVEAAQGDIEAAIEDLNKIIATHPDFYLAYVARARVYQKQSQYEKAIVDARKAIELKKGKFPLAHLIIGESYLSLGKLGEADQEIFLAIEESGRVPSGEAQHYKALITERKGNFLGSLPDRALALQLGYIDPPPLTIIGREVLSSDKVFNGFTTIIAGDHFVCYSDLSKEKLERYSAIVEGFANYTSGNLCPLQGEYPALLFILHDKGSEQRFLRDRMEFNRGVHGVFLSGRNSVVTYDGAGTGVLLHEVMHKFLYNTKPHDNWADEGVASFFEKSYGYLYKTGESSPQSLSLLTGFPDSGSQFWLWLTHKTLKLSQIVTDAKYADPDHEDEQRMVALFLNKNDKLKQFLTLTFKGDPGKYKYYIEAAFNKPLSELNPLFDAYVAELNKSRDEIIKLPPAEILKDKESFERFLKDHKISPTTHF
jgi:tetratricopeptide (TPR) repeat protein